LGSGRAICGQFPFWTEYSEQTHETIIT